MIYFLGVNQLDTALPQMNSINSNQVQSSMNPSSGIVSWYQTSESN